MEAVFWNIGTDHPITPAEPLPELPEIPRGSMVIISGRAPVWRYGLAFHVLHGSAASAIATFDPKLGAVIVASHTPNVKEGSVLNIEIGQEEIEL